MTSLVVASPLVVFTVSFAVVAHVAIESDIVERFHRVAVLLERLVALSSGDVVAVVSSLALVSSLAAVMSLAVVTSRVDVASLAVLASLAISLTAVA